MNIETYFWISVALAASALLGAYIVMIWMNYDSSKLFNKYIDIQKEIEKNKEYELPWDKDYFMRWQSEDNVPCIVCKEFMPRMQTVITRDGFKHSKCMFKQGY